VSHYTHVVTFLKENMQTVEHKSADVNCFEYTVVRGFHWHARSIVKVETAG